VATIRFSLSRFEEFLKAIQHKYIRKYEGAGGKPRYIYADKRANRHGEHSVSGKHLTNEEHYKEGSMFSAGAGKGHYVIDKIEGDRVSYHLDDTDGKGTPGEAQHSSLTEFKAMTAKAHEGAAKKHAEAGLSRRVNALERAKKIGSRPHVERAEKEVARWQGVHKEHLPKPKKEEAKQPTAEPPKEEAKPPTPKQESAPIESPEEAKVTSKKVRGVFEKLQRGDLEIDDALGQVSRLMAGSEAARTEAKKQIKFMFGGSEGFMSHFDKAIEAGESWVVKALEWIKG